MDDKTLIINLGGPAKLARLLGFGKGGTNRVCNWRSRGIPAAVKLDFPHIFLVPAKKIKSQSKEASHA